MLSCIHLIVLDSVGVGEAPDADRFGDVGADTLGHIAKEASLYIPNLEKMGLDTIRSLADKLLKVIQEDFNGLSFTNLVDFDVLYGHRRDPIGYARATDTVF